MSDQCAQLTTGRVKWFNKSQGYGFVTAVDGDKCGDDIFVHHSKLSVKEDQFRYLVEGEYISFKWSCMPTEVENRKWQATDVTGVCGGKLMCETHNDTRIEMSKLDNGDVKEHRRRPRASHRRVSGRRSASRSRNDNSGDGSDEAAPCCDTEQ